MKSIYVLIAALLLFSAPALAAPNEDISATVRKLEKQYETMKDFRADFTQETRLASINRTEKGAGSVRFKKPGKMLWEYTAPQAQKIILDGKTLWFYVPEDKQVMKNNFSTIPQHIVVDLFRGRISIREKFTVAPAGRQAQEAAPGLALELAPKAHDPSVKKLTLWIDPKKHYILRTCLEDDFGTRTVLSFSNIAIDTNIPDATFAFTVPPGVDVFEPPKGAQ